MDPDDRDALQRQINDLRERLMTLEAAARADAPLRSDKGPVIAVNAIAAPANKQDSALQGTPLQQSAPRRVPAHGWEPNFALVGEEPACAASHTAATTRQNRSLESRIGSQWFNRVGILAVLIGMAWFLKLAIDNQWIGPLGRVLIGLLTGIGIVAWSGRFRRTGYPVFAYSLQALGSGILYLSLWAAFSVYALLPSGVAFGAMIAVTAFNGYMAWQLDAQVLAVFSLSGGLGTPLLLSTGQNHEVGLFSYLLLLDAAVLVLVALKPWSRLLVGAFAGTALYVAGWWLRFYSDDQRLRTAVFAGLFFLLFAVAQRLGLWRANDSDLQSPSDRLAAFVLPVANATLAFLAFYGLFSGPGYTWAPPWLAVGFAAFHLALLFLPGRGVLRANSAVTSALNLALAVGFLAIAIPLKTHGRGLPIGWLVEGAVLLWLAHRFGHRLLRQLAAVCLVLGLGALLLMDPHASITPLLNQRFATYCTAIAVFAFVALLSRTPGAVPRDEDAPPRDSLGLADATAWDSLGLVAALLVNVLILLAVGWEIHNFWWFVQWRGNTPLLHDYRMYAQFTYSAFFMLFGALLLGIGFVRHSSFVRWQALVLLVVAIAKVFLGDVSSLSQGYRILSFLALGALLLAVSYVYQRDWLHLRSHDEEAA